MFPLLSQDWHLKGDGKCSVQIALVGTAGMRVTLRQRSRKNYALLYTEQMVCISFVINAFKKKFVLLMFMKYFCVYFSIYYYQNFLGFLFWHWFFECGASWSLEAPSDGYLLWFFLCGWSGATQSPSHWRLVMQGWYLNQVVGVLCKWCWRILGCCNERGDFL